MLYIVAIAFAVHTGSYIHIVDVNIHCIIPEAQQKLTLHLSIAQLFIASVYKVRFTTIAEFIKYLEHPIRDDITAV